MLLCCPLRKETLTGSIVLKFNTFFFQVYENLFQAASKMYANEGIRSFYKGETAWCLLPQVLMCME